jgi:hypothetical protein
MTDSIAIGRATLADPSLRQLRLKSCSKVPSFVVRQLASEHLPGVAQELAIYLRVNLSVLREVLRAIGPKVCKCIARNAFERVQAPCDASRHPLRET